MKLSIIIPVYNEEKTVAEILRRVSSVKLPKRLEKEIIVIDDGSSDKTADVLSNVEIKNVKIIKHLKNQGKGAAVRTGLNMSRGDIFLIQDADLEYNPQDYLKLLRPILTKKTQVVYGNRFQNYPLRLWGKEKTPLPTHWIGNKFLSFVFNLLYQSNLSDMETCYKVFTKEVLNKLNLKSNKFEIEPEVTAKILKNGYKIFEVPIEVKPRTHQEGKKINWKDGFIALGTLIKYRFVD